LLKDRVAEIPKRKTRRARTFAAFEYGKRADLLATMLEPARKELIEGLGVPQVLVRQPGPLSIPDVCRARLHGDVLGDLEPEFVLPGAGTEVDTLIGQGT